SQNIRASAQTLFCLFQAFKSDDLSHSQTKNASLGGEAFWNAGGERGIRTPGTLRYAGFQDRCIRPLCHFSAAKVRKHFISQRVFKTFLSFLFFHFSYL